jgi:hypothetical protein
MTTQPLWRQAVDTVDSAITPALERVVHDETFGLVVAVLHRARRGVGARVERTSRELRDLRKAIVDQAPQT